IQRVLAAIDFDDKAPLAADKIDNVRTDRMLPYELVTAELARAKLIPDIAFCFGGEAAKRAAARRLYFAGAAHLFSCPSPVSTGSRSAVLRPGRAKSPGSLCR